MKKILLTIALSLPLVSFGYFIQSSPTLMTRYMQPDEYKKGAGLEHLDIYPDWYCEITLHLPYIEEGDSIDLARGVGDDFSKMVIRVDDKIVTLNEQNTANERVFIWLNAKDNIYVTFNANKIEHDEMGMPVIYGEMMLLTPQVQEFYPGIYYCRD